MVWCALFRGEIIGPYFFENESFTGVTYKRKLRYFFITRLQNYPETKIFQQDGPPPHYAISVREYLDRKIPNRWMGRGKPISRPARSPDLKPCDYFSWGYIKNLVYSQRPDTISELKTKNRQAVQSINGDILRNVYKNMETCLSIFVREQGGRFEHLIN